MRAITSFVIAGVTGLALTSAASATDLMSMDTMSDDTMMMSHDTGFDWAGFYIGVTGGAWVEPGTTYTEIAKVVGYNFTPSEKVILGIEGMVGDVFGPGNHPQASIAAHFGLALGEKAQIYKVGELGYIENTWYYGLGVGMEFAVGDQLTLRGEVEGVGFFPGGGIEDIVPSVGLIWHAN